jgi:hypothetical protein
MAALQFCGPPYPPQPALLPTEYLNPASLCGNRLCISNWCFNIHERLTSRFPTFSGCSSSTQNDFMNTSVRKPSMIYQNGPVTHTVKKLYLHTSNLDTIFGTKEGVVY